jgi:predicted ArsR family transcriptional regulator
MYASELAKGLGLERNTVMGSFHRLETAGFARQVDEPRDAPPQDRGGDPRTWFELTPEGQNFASSTVRETQRSVRAQARTIGVSL